MPTAVERGFLKLNQWENPGEQQQLTQAFLKIDGILTGLEDATTGAFLKLEHSTSARHTFDMIGDGFVKLGGDFGKIATVASAVDRLEIAAFGEGGGAGDVARALTTSAGDLKTLGGDFLKLDQSSSREEFNLKLHNLEAAADTVSKGMLGDGSVFNALGADFVRLGSGDETQMDNIYKSFGGSLQSIGSDFNALAGGFHKLDEALSNLGSGGGRPNPDVPTVGSALGALNSEMLALTTDLHAAVAPAAAVLAGVIRQDVFGGGGGSGFDGHIFSDIYGGGGGSGFGAFLGLVRADIYGGGGGSGRIG